MYYETVMKNRNFLILILIVSICSLYLPESVHGRSDQAMQFSRSLQAAVEATRVEDYQLALKRCREAEVLVNKNPSLYAVRSFIYMSMEEYDTALKNINKAISIDGFKPKLYAQRGDIQLAQRDYKNALRSYRKAITIDPEYYEVLSEMGYIYTRDRKFEKARKCLNRAVALEPKNKRAHYRRAQLFSDTGEFEKAWYDLLKSERLGRKQNKKLRYILSIKISDEAKREIEARLDEEDRVRLKREIEEKTANETGEKGVPPIDVNQNEEVLGDGDK